jgi:hypothetical protein
MARFPLQPSDPAGAWQTARPHPERALAPSEEAIQEAIACVRIAGKQLAARDGGEEQMDEALRLLYTALAYLEESVEPRTAELPAFRA